MTKRTARRKHKIGQLVLSIDLEKNKSMLGMVSDIDDTDRDDIRYNVEWYDRTVKEEYFGYSHDSIAVFKEAYNKYNKKLSKKG